MVQLPVAGGAVVLALAIGSVAGFLVGSRRGGSGTEPAPQHGLDPLAERLELPPRPDPMAEGIETMIEAVDAAVETTGIADAGDVPADGTPVERARALERAAKSGTLLEDGDGSADESTTAGQQSGTLDPGASTDAGHTERTPPALTGAVETVRSRHQPASETGRRLLDYLESAEETSEGRLTDTLESTVATLDRHEELTTVLDTVQPAVEPAELGQTLESRSRTVDGEIGATLETLGGKLSEVSDRASRCASERNRLQTSAQRIATAANDQSSVSFTASGSTGDRLEELAEYVEDGSVGFTDRRTSIDRIVGRIEPRLAPESTLARELVDTLTSESIDPEDCEETLVAAVDAIDTAETVRHRLDGVTVDDVERLAGRVVDEFDATDSPSSGLLADRAADLESTVSQAGDADLVTVYAARQELRFYDRQLLPQLRQGSTDAGQDRDVDTLSREVEERRSRMRQEYPTEYPEHDHSIPIHFLELVSSLQEAADEARANENDERAIGYLKAGDRTLDWVAELYERHAYNVLLEQLRG